MARNDRNATKPPKKPKKVGIKALPKGTSPSDTQQAARTAKNKLRNIAKAMDARIKAEIKRGTHHSDYDLKVLMAKAERIAIAQAELDKLAA